MTLTLSTMYKCAVIKYQQPLFYHLGTTWYPDKYHIYITWSPSGYVLAPTWYPHVHHMNATNMTHEQEKRLTICVDLCIFLPTHHSVTTWVPHGTQMVFKGWPHNARICATWISPGNHRNITFSSLEHQVVTIWKPPEHLMNFTAFTRTSTALPHKSYMMFRWYPGDYHKTSTYTPHECHMVVTWVSVWTCIFFWEICESH